MTVSLNGPDTLSALGSVLLIQSAAMASPGPNFFLIVNTAVNAPRALPFLVPGFACAGLVFSSGTLIVVLTAGAAAGDIIFRVLNFIGATYLIWLGVSAIRSARRANPHPRTASIAMTPAKAFLGSLLTNLANFKTVAFFGSVFATRLPLAQMGATESGAVLAAIFFNSVAVHGALATLALRPVILRQLINHKRVLQIGTGSLFIAFGLWTLSNVISEFS